MKNETIANKLNEYIPFNIDKKFINLKLEESILDEKPNHKRNKAIIKDYKKLTQTQLAKKYNLSQKQISNILKGPTT